MQAVAPQGKSKRGSGVKKLSNGHYSLMKKTRWFPGTQKPELSGVYERDYGHKVFGHRLFFSYYHNGIWGDGCIDKRDAVPAWSSDGANQPLPWRGITPNT